MSMYAAILLVRVSLERLAAALVARGSRWLQELSEGQSMVEYAIVIALIAIAALAAIQALGGGIAQLFQRILTSIQGVG